MLDYGEALKYQREVNGLSQSELSRKTGIKQENISRWEQSKVIPSMDFCVQLADFYNISLDELVGRDWGRKERTI